MQRESEISLLLAELREEYPAVQVDVEHVQLDAGRAVFRSVITLPNGGRAMGYGSAEGNDATLIRRAQIDALASALQVLGYGSEHLVEMTPAPAGTDATARAASGVLPTAPEEEYDADPFNLGPSPSAADVAAATGVQLGVPRDRVPDQRRPAARELTPEEDNAAMPKRPAPPEGPPPQRESAPMARASRNPPRRAARTDEEADQQNGDADVVHSSFWQWAEQRGLHSQEEIEALLGRSIRGLVPATVRQMIIEAQADQES